MIALYLFTTVKPVKNETLYAANFSIYDALKKIAPAGSDVKLFIPAGEDIHSFQPNPHLLALASKSKRLFFVKGSINGWLEKVIETNISIPFSDLSLGVQWIKADDHDSHEHGHDDHDEDYDPHYWLSIENQLIVAENLLHELITLFPAEKRRMNENHQVYKKSLIKLHSENQNILNSCKKQTIIVTHNAFSYLAKSYGFKVKSIVGLTPEGLSNPKKLKDIIELISHKGYEMIFSEDFISDVMVQTIKKEVDVSIDRLHPLATVSLEALNSAKSYQEFMIENVTKISKAMQCQ